MQPIQDVHIHTKKYTTETNTLGEFELINLPKGDYVLEFSHLSYQELDKNITIDKDIYIKIVLLEKINSIEEVFVEDKKKYKSNRSDIITSKTIDRNSSTTLADITKKITGVHVLKTGNSITKPIINGLHSNRVLILNEGVKIEDQQWGVEHSTNVDINSFNKIEVIKGASALEYGTEAIGGFIVLENNLQITDTLKGKFIHNLHTNGRGLSSHLNLLKSKENKWLFGINGTFKYFGDRFSPDYNLSNTGNREKNGGIVFQVPFKKHLIKLNYNFYSAETGILKASHIGNSNDLYQAIALNEPYIVEDFTYNINNPKQISQHHFLKLEDVFNFNNHQNLTFQYAFQLNNREEFDTRRGDDKNKAALDLQLKSHILKFIFSSQSRNNKYKSGINYQYQTNVANPATGIRPLIPDFEKIEVGLFTMLQKTFSKNWDFEIGGRLDYVSLLAYKYYLKSRWNERNYQNEFKHFIIGEYGNQYLTKPEFDYFTYSFVTGFKKTFHHDYYWYFNFALSNRTPNVSELFSDGLHHSNAQIELGDLRLQPEKSFKFNSNFVKKWTSCSIEINPYYNFISNFMFLKPIGIENTIRGSFPVWEHQQTNASITGVDMSWKSKIGKYFKYNLGYSYLHGWNHSTSDFLIDMPPMQLNSSISFEIIKSKFNFNSTINNEFVFKQYNYPNYDYTAQIVSNNQIIDVIVPISKTPANYTLLNWANEINFKYFKTNECTIVFSIDNLTNTKYRDYLNRQRFFVDELGRNIQLSLLLNF